MAELTAEMLLRPVSAESPCGDDLRQDGRYLEILRQAEGKPERVMGDKTIPAEDPDWRLLKDGCAELFARTKDLRLCVVSCLTQCKLGGYPALRHGLETLRTLLDQHWEGVHPRLDPEDNNDPTERCNIVAQLATPVGSFGDPYRFLERLRDAPIIESKSVGKISLTDILISMGQLPPPVQPDGSPGRKLDLALIDAAFEDVELGPLEASVGSIEGCLEEVRGIDAAFAKWVGPGKGPDLSRLRNQLADAAQQARKRLAKRGGSAGVMAGGVADSGVTPAPVEGISGEVRSNDDALLALDRICQYYERVEPSSPVPLAARAAKRLIGLKFEQIAAVLTPDVVATLQRLASPEQQQG